MPATHHRFSSTAAGLQADGSALPNGPARDALAPLLQALEAEARRPGARQAALLCHAHTELARALSGLCAYGPADSHLAQALHWAQVMAAPDTQADLTCARAEVAHNSADLARAQGAPHAVVNQADERARQHAFEAARLAGLTSDPHWEVKLLLRASDVLDRCGEHSDAVHLQHRALVLMGLHNPDPAGDALPTEPLASEALALTAPGQLM